MSLIAKRAMLTTYIVNMTGSLVENVHSGLGKLLLKRNLVTVPDTFRQRTLEL